MISWKRSRSSSAFSRPRSLGISTETATSSGRSMRGQHLAASASCGITSARTKLVTSMRCRPVRASASIRRTLSAVAMTSGSFWKPSRGPTSRMRTLWAGLGHRTREPIVAALERARRHHRRHWRARLRPRAALGPRRRARRHRLARRRPRREAAERARAALPDGDFEGLANAEAATEAEVVVLCVPFRNQSETLTNLKATLREGQLVVDATVPLAAAVSGRATRMLGVWQGRPPSRPQEMVPDGVRVVSALHTVSAATLGDLEHAARRGRPRLRRPQGRQERVIGAGRPHRRPAPRRRRPPGAGADRRVADRAADLDQRAPQDARRASGSPAAVTARSSSWPAAPAARSSPAGCSTSSATTSS